MPPLIVTPGRLPSEVSVPLALMPSSVEVTVTVPSSMRISGASMPSQQVFTVMLPPRMAMAVSLWMASSPALRVMAAPVMWRLSFT